MFARFRSGDVLPMLTQHGVDIRHILASLGDQQVLEALEPDSKVSYQSGVNSWINFCDMLNELVPGCKPPSSQLDVSEDEVLWWIALLVKRSTAYSYRTHLKLACALARKPVTGLTSPLVNMALRGKVSGNPIDVQTKKWVCGKDLLLKMVDYCLCLLYTSPSPRD